MINSKLHSYTSADISSKKSDELLKLKISQLDLTVSGSILERAQKQLYKELKDAGFNYFFPQIYLADEWFSSEGLAIIAAPFYLASEKLISLEKQMIGYAEGDRFSWCMKLLRHETGHCLDHLYKFSKTEKWKNHFGNPEKNTILVIIELSYTVQNSLRI